jgi:phage recombination protein Bet
MANEIIKQEAVTTLAERYNVDNASLLNMLARTSCKDIRTDDDMLAFVIICKNYQLNPLVKEIYAYKNSFGAIVPVVGIDGWLAIANRNPMFDGIQCDPIFEDSRIVAIKCTIWRKDRSHPAVHIEYMRACKQNSKPWQTHPERMLEWKAIIQTIRIAFSISGIYDPDEAELIEPDAKQVITEVEYSTKDDNEIKTISQVINDKIDEKQDIDDGVSRQADEMKGNAKTLKIAAKNGKRKDLIEAPGEDGAEFDNKFDVKQEKKDIQTPLGRSVNSDAQLLMDKKNLDNNAAEIIALTMQKDKPMFNKILKEVAANKRLLQCSKTELEQIANRIMDNQAKDLEDK